MGIYLLKRLGASIVTALLATFLIFALVRMVPGDVVAQMMGQAGGPQAEAALRAFFGLDAPIHVQYVTWLGDALRGDLGVSWTRGIPVTDMVVSSFLVTLQLGLVTLAVATVIGVPLGILAGIYEGRPIDTLIQGFNVIGLSAPVFWVGLMLLVAVSGALSWSPPLRSRASTSPSGWISMP